MNALRAEADESAAKVEELSAKVRTLEQENLQKEQEITSLQHKNGVLEQEVDKLEGLHKDAKAAVDESAQHGTQNESLQRRLQLLEEEAEENDKNLRETNEKYVLADVSSYSMTAILTIKQAPSDRCQGRPLRAQGPGSRAVRRPVGEEVRGHGQEVQRHQEGARRLRCGDW